MTPDERRAAFSACDRHVFGHGPPDLARAVAALAAELRPDDRADTYGAGPTIEAFEAEVSALLGRPAAVFLPSGTLAQVVALRIWAGRTGCRSVAFHPTSHLELHEHHAYAHLHGLRVVPVGPATRPLARADLEAVREPVGALLLELPQRELGGTLPTWDERSSLLAWAHERRIPVHLDGARLWETRPFYGRSYAEICDGFDSVYVSFYKILGGIAGAVLAGPADFVAEARVWQRRQGGNLVTQWPLVLSARRGLRERLPRVAEYVAHARRVAEALAALPGVRVSPWPPPTNLMHVFLPCSPDEVAERAAAIARDERVAVIRAAQPTGVPGVSKVEVTVGDATLAHDADAIAGWFRRLAAP